MMKFRIISISVSVFFMVSLSGVKAADLSGIWIVKYDKYQVIVTGSGDSYKFRKISFYRGKRSETGGSFTVQNGNLKIQYNGGQKAAAVIKNPAHIVESSTVNWEKVNDSVNYPLFNLSGTWKNFNSEIVLKQNGSVVTGIKYFNGKEYSRFNGEVEGYLLRLKENYISSIKPMEHSLVILDNNRLVFSSSRNSQDNLWLKNGDSAVKDEVINKVEPDKSKISEKTLSYEISGEWRIEGIESGVKITEKKPGVFFNTFFILGKKKVKWAGSGSRDGESILLKYRYTANKPAGFENGTMNLKVINDSRIEGAWVSDSGKYRDRIVFLKVK